MASYFTVNNSEFEFRNRIDAELYQPNLRSSLRSLKISGYVLKKLSSLFIIRSGTTPPDRKDGLIYGPILLKTTDIRNEVLPYDGDYYHIEEHIHRRMQITKLQQKDVLLNIVGATLEVIGRTAFLDELPEEANITQAMVFLRAKSSEIVPGFLFVYLCSSFAKDQIKRFARPTGQYNLNLQEVGQILIPICPNHFQQEIDLLVMRSAKLLKDADESYSEAQQLLETELGLDRLNLQKPVGYTARFSTVGLSQAFAAGRIDAQCYSPLALFYEKWLMRQGSSMPLSLLLEGTAKGRQQIDSEAGTVDYCSIKHISSHEIANASKCFPKPDTPLATTNDLLLAVTGATIGKVGIVRRYKQLAYSGDLLRMRANNRINPYYLLLALEHPLGQVQFNRWITGSTNGHLAPRDVRRILVPRIHEDAEAEINEMVRKSTNLRQESETLLEQAKTRVEQMIEEAVQHETLA